MLRRTLRTPDDLVEAGFVPLSARDELAKVAARYATAIPPAMAALIGQDQGAIARQFIPDPSELHAAAHESSDPIGDEALSPIKGVVHRYPDRVLLKPTLVCPVYCRFCFRREHVGPGGGALRPDELDAAIDWIGDHSAITEVIITGGDPMILSARRIRTLLRRLGDIPHVKRLRIHTRVPVAVPDLINDAMIAALDVATPLFLVVHANHALEFTDPAQGAMRRLRFGGIPLLGQSVLLRGINDSERALRDLFEAMLNARVKPYYLHQLDPAPGTARFYVPVAEGRALIAKLRGTIGGHALPTYVRDSVAGKRVLEESAVSD